MTTELTIAGINILDRTKYRYEIQDPEPTRDKDISPNGCGTSPGKGGVVNKNQLVYEARKFIIWCVDESGMSYQTCKTNRGPFDDLVAADFVTNKKYLVRRILDETEPTVWTILTADYREVRQDLSNLPYILIELELDVTPGAEFLDGDGYPAAGASPGANLLSVFAIEETGSLNVSIAGGTLTMESFDFDE